MYVSERVSSSLKRTPKRKTCISIYLLVFPSKSRKYRFHLTLKKKCKHNQNIYICQQKKKEKICALHSLVRGISPFFRFSGFFSIFSAFGKIKCSYPPSLQYVWWSTVLSLDLYACAFVYPEFHIRSSFTIRKVEQYLCLSAYLLMICASRCG